MFIKLVNQLIKNKIIYQNLQEFYLLKAMNQLFEKKQHPLHYAREQISPYYSAARIWTDAVINPLDTRIWISMGIEAANHAPIEKQFNMGIIQV